MPAAKVLDHKLANWSGGRRYTCPSYEITRLTDGVTISIPGFQPFPVYGVDPRQPRPRHGPPRARRAPPSRSSSGVAFPLSTQEVATVCEIPFDQAREELGRVATQEYVGADGFWHRNGG